MGPLRRGAVLVVLALAAALGGCSEEEDPVLSGACQAGPDPFETALRDAPGPVRLGDGTPLAECVRTARNVSQLQELGINLTRVADRLASRALRDGDEAAALQLGYLLGAVRIGASTTEGIAVELERRMGGTASGVRSGPAALQAALRRGIAAGERPPR